MLKRPKRRPRPEVRPKTRSDADDRVGPIPESDEEKKAGHALAKKFAPRFHNRSLGDMRENCRDAGDAYKAAKGKVNVATLAAIQAACEMCLYIEARGERESWRNHHRKSGMRFHRDAHLLGQIIRAEVYNNSDTANRWSEAGRYALINGIDPEEISEFIKKEGGIEACVDKFRALSRRKQTPSQNARDKTKREARSGEPKVATSKVKRRVPCTAWKSGPNEIKRAAKFERRFEAYAVAMRRVAEGCQVRIAGHLSKNGQLRLQNIKFVKFDEKASRV